MALRSNAQQKGMSEEQTCLSPHLKRQPCVKGAARRLPGTADPGLSAPAKAHRTPGGMYCADQMLPTISSASLGETLSAACRVFTGTSNVFYWSLEMSVRSKSVIRPPDGCCYLEKH